MISTRLSTFHNAITVVLPSYKSIRFKSTHVFEEVIPWNHAKALADHLAKNVLYNHGGVVAVNKPYGVGSSSKGSTKQYINAAPVGNKIFNIYDALPYLAKTLGYEELFLASIPERYTSGVTVLATTPYLMTRVKDCIQLSKVSDDTMNKYYAIVLRSPNAPSGTIHLGIKISSTVPGQPMLVSLTRRGLQKGTMHSVRAVYDTLSSSSLASLLAIRSSTARLMALRIICTDKLVSPILGDNMFGSRVKEVLGKPALVGFNAESIKKPMKLKSDILEALELAPEQELIVPTHLHLHEVYLAKFFNVDIVLRAPLPSVFQWSCSKLGLELPECRPCEKFLRRDVLKQNQENYEPKMKKEEDKVEIGVVT